MQDGLVEQAQRGDAEAFDTLARMVGDRCLAIAVRILRDHDLAESTSVHRCPRRVAALG